MAESDNINKILFSDIDETLVNTDKTLCSENRAAISKLLGNGDMLAIATGRAHEGAANLLKKLGLYGEKNIIICSYDGGIIYDPFHDETLFKRAIPKDIIVEAFDIARENHMHIHAYSGRSVISESDNRNIQRYLSVQQLDLVLVSSIKDADIISSPKLLCLDYDDPQRLSEFRSLFERRMAGRLDCFNSNPWLLEIVPPGVNKGAAVRFVADYYDVPIADTVSAGDAENDLEMIKAAGVGCAMKNGDEVLKRVADYVTVHDNNHGGVAEIINKFCLN